MKRAAHLLPLVLVLLLAGEAAAQAPVYVTNAKFANGYRNGKFRQFSMMPVFGTLTTNGFPDSTAQMVTVWTFPTVTTTLTVNGGVAGNYSVVHPNIGAKANDPNPVPVAVSFWKGGVQVGPTVNMLFFRVP